MPVPAPAGAVDGTRVHGWIRTVERVEHGDGEPVGAAALVRAREMERLAATGSRVGGIGSRWKTGVLHDVVLREPVVPGVLLPVGERRL